MILSGRARRNWSATGGMSMTRTRDRVDEAVSDEFARPRARGMVQITPRRHDEENKLVRSLMLRLR